MESCSVYTVCGKRVRVNDSFDIAMRVLDLMADPLFGSEERFELLLLMLFPNPEGFVAAFADESVAALTCVIESVFGGEDSTGEKIIDWHQDAARVRVTMRQAYGLGDEFCKLAYRHVLELVCMAPRDTPMGEALYWRCAERPKDMTPEQARHFDALKEHYALADSTAKSFKAQNEAMTATLEKMRRRANV